MEKKGVEEVIKQANEIVSKEKKIYDGGERSAFVDGAEVVIRLLRNRQSNQLQQGGEGIRWVKASEQLPEDDGVYVCKLEKKGGGTRDEKVSYMDYRFAYEKFMNTYNDGFEVIEWLYDPTS